MAWKWACLKIERFRTKYRPDEVNQTQSIQKKINQTYSINIFVLSLEENLSIVGTLSTLVHLGY